MKISDLIEGLQILAKYEEKGTEAYTNGADHDVIYGCSADVGERSEAADEAYLEEHGEYPDIADQRMSDEDNARLRDLGWFVEPDSEAWWHYT